MIIKMSRDSRRAKKLSTKLFDAGGEMTNNIKQIQINLRARTTTESFSQSVFKCFSHNK